MLASERASVKVADLRQDLTDETVIAALAHHTPGRVQVATTHTPIPGLTLEPLLVSPRRAPIAFQDGPVMENLE